MAVKFEFYLSDEDYDRMAIIKAKKGKDDLTFAEFAREIVENELYRLHPTKPTEEELE